ncbi:MAG: threonine/serine exporter family protein [Bacteroidales bacterium]
MSIPPAADLKTITGFIADYATRLLGSGVHTSRVVRNSKRIGIALCVQVKMTIFAKSIILTVADEQNEDICTEVLEIPELPVSFELNSDLSSLSWEAHDKKMSLNEIQNKYAQIIDKPQIQPLLVLFLVSIANAAFCRLFGGDWGAMGIVFIATSCGFFAKQQMQKRKISPFIIVVISSFIASLVASISLLFNIRADIAIATSVLYLIPGVPLLNGVIDIIEGHILIGFSRLAQSFLLVICIAIGLSFTLVIFKNSLL